VLRTDSILGLTPPGGSHLNEFGCLSCHDAHDNGNFRNLKREINGQTTLVEAVADPSYQDNIYIAGMDTFCAACHQKFHGEANTRGARSWTRHPTGITIYGQTNADFSRWAHTIDPITKAEYPTGNTNNLASAKVFCLSCHFAHGSRYKNGLRWPNERSSTGCLECHSLDND